MTGEERSGFARRLRSALPPQRTLSEIAADIGVSLSGLKKWLSGAAEPGRTHLVEAARALGVTVGWLATGAAPRHPGEASEAEPDWLDHGFAGTVLEALWQTNQAAGSPLGIGEVGRLASAHSYEICRATRDPVERAVMLKLVLVQVERSLRRGAPGPR